MGCQTTAVASTGITIYHLLPFAVELKLTQITADGFRLCSLFTISKRDRSNVTQFGDWGRQATGGRPGAGVEVRVEVREAPKRNLTTADDGRHAYTNRQVQKADYHVAKQILDWGGGVG